MKTGFFFLINFFFSFIVNGFSTDLETLFPDAFLNKPLGIKVSPKNEYGVDFWMIENFTGSNTNRNHFDSRKDKPITSLVMHYTVSNFPRTMDIFTENKDNNRVSAHYTITEQDLSLGIKGGVVIQNVAEEERAWHAGVSDWQEIHNLNETSIGIENINKGWVENQEGIKTWFHFDQNQIDMLGKLSSGIINKYKINPTKIIGHSDIAFSRKQDPGILFPWNYLYEKFGIGAFIQEHECNKQFINNQYLPKEPLPNGISAEFFLKNLSLYGYKIENPDAMTPENESALKAFKAHFSENQNPQNYDAPLTRKDVLISWGLVSKYREFLP